MTTAESGWWSPWREAEGATILHVDLMPDEDSEARAFALLDDEERVRWHKFPVAAPRRRFALCRAALRIALAERLGCSNRRLSFGHGEHGKPFALVDGRRAPVGFNVSHANRHGLIAVAAHDWLGVDVEERAPGRDLDGIGSMVYGPTEQRLLTIAAGSRKVHLFYRLWSMKEALIKALGSGFSLNPSRFQIPAPMLHGVRASAFRFPHDPSSSWRLIDLGEDRFAAALAYRVPPGGAIRHSTSTPDWNGPPTAPGGRVEAAPVSTGTRVPAGPVFAACGHVAVRPCNTDQQHYHRQACCMRVP